MKSCVRSHPLLITILALCMLVPALPRIVAGGEGFCPAAPAPGQLAGGPAGRNEGSAAAAVPRGAGCWEDHFENFSKTNYTGKALFISNSNVSVGGSGSMFEPDMSTVLLYHFDEGQGGTAVDSGPNKLNGTLNNMDTATDWVPGVNGTALDFDGSNDNVQTASSAVFNVNRVTVEAWVYQRTSEPYSDKFVVAKRQGFYLMDHSFSLDTPGVVSARNTNSILNKWVYLAGSYDGNTVRFYRNGAQAASANTAAGMSHSTTYLQVGAWGGGSPYYVFDGLIEEVRVSNIARTAQDINNTYQSYLAGNSTNLTPSASLCSEKITVPNGNYWDRLNIVKYCQAGTYINVTVLDNATGKPVPGFENLTGADVNLSGINPLRYPSLNLEAEFRTSGKISPSLDCWNVSWRPNIPPDIVGLSIPDSVMRTAAAAVTVTVNDPDQSATGLMPGLECRYRNETTWRAIYFGAPAYQGSGVWTSSFQPDAGAYLGPYQIRAMVTDDMGANATKASEGAIYVYSEKNVSVDIPQKGISIYRCDTRNLIISAELEGPPKDFHFSVEVTSTDGNPCTWVAAPFFESGEWKIRVAPPADAKLGAYAAHVAATNDYWQTAEASLPNVFIVKNNPPRGSCAQPLILQEDVLGKFDLSGFLSDRDTPLDKLAVQLLKVNETGKADISVEGRVLSVTALCPDWFGQLMLNLSVSDSIDRTNFTAELVVQPARDAPRVENLTEISCFEDTTLVYNFSAHDPDPGDNLFYILDLGGLKGFLGSVEGYSFSFATGRLVLPLTNDMVGAYSCNLNASDGLLTTSVPFRLIVINVNDPPAWKDLPANTTISAGTVYSFDVNATDSDAGDALVYEVSSSPPSNIAIDPGTGMLKWTPKTNGTYNVTVSARDQQVTISHVFRIVVIRVNHAPRIVSFAPENDLIKMTVGQALDFQIEATDEDGDLLKYTWSVDGSERAGSSSYSFKPATAGYQKILVKVSDGTDTASRQWNIDAREGLSVGGAFPGWLLPLVAVVVVAGALVGYFAVRRRRN